MKNPASLLLSALPLTLACAGDEHSSATGGTAGAGGTPGMSGAGGSIFSATPASRPKTYSVGTAPTFDCFDQ